VPHTLPPICHGFKLEVLAPT